MKKPRICPVCGKEFIPETRMWKFCSIKCRDKRRKEIKIQADKTYYRTHKETHNLKAKQYRESHKEEIKKYNDSRKDKVKQYNKNREQRWKDQGIYKEKKKYYRQRHKEKAKETRKIYYKNNKKAINATRNEYAKKQRKTDPAYRIKHKIRGILRRCLGSKKDKHTFDILGYTVSELLARLDSLFYNGMTWENADSWEIHHIIPISQFSFIDEHGNIDYNKVKQANALSNLIPLWKEDHKKVTAIYLSEGKILTLEEIKELFNIRKLGEINK